MKDFKSIENMTQWYETMRILRARMASFEPPTGTQRERTKAAEIAKDTLQS